MALIISIAVALYLGGCKQDDTPPPPPWVGQEMKISNDGELLESIERLMIDSCQSYLYEDTKSNSGVPQYKPINPDCYTVDPSDISAGINVNIYFVRHGESTWNNNHDLKPSWNPHHRDALLTAEGVEQALKLSDEISKRNTRGTDTDHDILNGIPVNGHKVVYATSNLRRATYTFLLSFHHLLKQNLINKLYILSALQEVCGNMDCNSLSGPGEIPKLSYNNAPWLPKVKKNIFYADPAVCPYDYKQMTSIMDATCNDGDEASRPVPVQDPNSGLGNNIKYATTFNSEFKAERNNENFCVFI